MPFSDALQRLREQAGLSQSRLADRAGVSVRSIQNWEQGHRGPSASVVLTLAQALSVPVERLLSELKDTGKPKHPKPRGRPPKAPPAPPPAEDLQATAAKAKGRARQKADATAF